MGEEIGSVEVICGSMFSGKTEEMIRRLRRAVIAKQNVQVFKPAIDNRYNVDRVTSHAGIEFEAIPVEKSDDIYKSLKPDTTVVGIDEAQFFDDGLVDVCNQLADRGIRVIVAGLDMDYKGVPFGPMPGLMSVAEYVTKVHAICVKCGNLANYTHRMSEDDKLIVLGETDIYEPLCRICYTKDKTER